MIKKIYKDAKEDYVLLEKQDRDISFAIVFQLCMLITNYTFKQVLNITNTSIREIISGLFMILVGVYFLKNLTIVLKRVGKLFFSVYFIFIIIVLFNILMFPNNIEYIIGTLLYLFFICIPTAIYYVSINDKSIFLDVLTKSAYYQMTLGIIFFVSTDLSILKYDMVYSYLILVPITIFLYKLSNNFSLLDLCLSIFGVFAIIILGSRGPLLALLIYCLTLIGYNILKNDDTFRNRMFYLVGFVLLLLCAVYYKKLIFKINSLLQYLGISSRTMLTLLSDTNDFSSGRIGIYNMTLDKIAMKPILGYGFVGDRVFLNGTYPHNIFLEILAQFGVIIGGVTICVFVFYWIRGVFRNNDKVERDLAMMFFGIGLVQLFVSGSYITSSNFWLFMAICISSVHNSK